MIRNQLYNGLLLISCGFVSIWLEVSHTWMSFCVLLKKGTTSYIACTYLCRHYLCNYILCNLEMGNNKKFMSWYIMRVIIMLIDIITILLKSTTVTTIVKISSLHGVIRGSYTYLLLYNVFQVIEHAHTHDEVNICTYVATIIYQLSNSTTYSMKVVYYIVTATFSLIFICF